MIPTPICEQVKSFQSGVFLFLFFCNTASGFVYLHRHLENCYDPTLETHHIAKGAQSQPKRLSLGTFSGIFYECRVYDKGLVKMKYMNHMDVERFLQLSREIPLIES